MLIYCNRVTVLTVTLTVFSPDGTTTRFPRPTDGYTLTLDGITAIRDTEGEDLMIHANEVTSPIQALNIAPCPDGFLITAIAGQWQMEDSYRASVNSYEVLPLGGEHGYP